MGIGEFLRQLRTSKNVPVKAVATKAHVDPSLISRVESGERNVTNKIIEAYAVETGHLELLGLSEQTAPWFAEWHQKAQIGAQVIQMVQG